MENIGPYCLLFFTDCGPHLLRADMTVTDCSINPVSSLYYVESDAMYFIRSQEVLHGAY